MPEKRHKILFLIVHKINVVTDVTGVTVESQW